MKNAEAKSAIIAYLTGHQVSPTDLEQACRTLATDRDCSDHLRSALGLSSEPSPCDAFTSRVAEFSGMSEEELREQMPEFVEHVAQCAECRDTYWSVRPLWSTRVGEAIQTLAEPIRLAFSRVGQLRPRGWEPPVLEQEIVYGTAGPSEEAMGRREWEIVLDDEHPERKLILDALAKPHQGLELTIRTEPGEDAWFSQLNMQCADRGRATQAVIFSGRLARLVGKPVLLAPGDWEIRIRSGEEDGMRTWIIPLSLSLLVEHEVDTE